MIPFDIVAYGYPWLAHDVIGGHVGVLNNSEEVFWEFGAIIMLNASYIFLFFSTPTWPSDHASANQEYAFVGQPLSKQPYTLKL